MSAKITPIPKTYAGVRFRSTLEADWAATLDELNVRWQYEPEAIKLPSGELYRCDFYLPEITTWLEVKGPLGGRLHKPAELATAVMHAPGCTGEETDEHPPWWQETSRGSRAEYICCDYGWWYPWQLVIIGAAPERSEITFRLGNVDDDEADIGQCRECDSWFFFGSTRSYRCRACGAHEGDHHFACASPPPFARAA